MKTTKFLKTAEVEKKWILIDAEDIINADKVHLTGNKRANKVYYRHTGYAGGLKETTAAKILDGRFPDRVMRKAVQRMLPKESPLARKQLSNLRVYAGAEHEHSAQNPEVVDFKSLSEKNVKRG